MQEKLRICKKILHWVKFGRLKMGDPVYTCIRIFLRSVLSLSIEFIPYKETFPIV